jgi:hypothetical protein
MIAEELQPDKAYNGVLVLIDTPAGMELGLDNTSWRVESKFKGIRHIPPGCHYLHYSLADEKNMFQIGKFMMFSTPKSKP